MTLMIALIGALIALKFKIPAACLIGSMFAVALYNACTASAFFPAHIKVFSTSLVGSYIGCKVSRKDLFELKKVWMPALLMAIAMLGYNMLASLFLCGMTSISGRTAIFALAPAGITDMSLVALDMGADAALVSTAQILRLMTVVSFSPLLIQRSISFLGGGTSAVEPERGGNLKMKPPELGEKLRELTSVEWKRTALTLLVGLPAGLIGKISGFPAGNLVFPMCVVMTLNLTTDKVFMPRAFRQAAQTLSGALIGVQFSLNALLNLKGDFVFILIVTAGWLVLNQVLGILLHRSTGLPMVTTFFASAAGGMAEMGIIAVELGAKSIQVMTFQLARQLSVLLFYPILVQGLVSMGLIL